jgi:hypothetical protein
MSTVLVKVKEMFSFQQELSGDAVCLIADGCQRLKKFILKGSTKTHDMFRRWGTLVDDYVIHVIYRLGKQLTTLVLVGERFTDDVYSYLKNCSR